MVKRIDLLTALETIQYWHVEDDYLYLCCYENWRYWSYRGRYHCERDLVSTWLIIHDEINQIYGAKHMPAWVYKRLTMQFQSPTETIIEDSFNDEIPF